MRSLKRATALLLVVAMVFAMLATSVFAEPETGPEAVKVFGIVYNELNVPIVGASVVCNDDSPDVGQTATTGEDGAFELTVKPGTAYTITIEADGMEPFIRSFTTDFAYDMGNITLSYPKVPVAFTLTNTNVRYWVTGNVPLTGELEESGTLNVCVGSTLTLAAESQSACTLQKTITVNALEETLDSDNTYKLENITSDQAIVVTSLDEVAPTITSVAISDENEWKPAKTLSVTATDNLTAAANLGLYLSYTEYDNAAQVEAEATALVGGQYILSVNNTYYVYAIDEAGNMTSESIAVQKLDSEAPVVSALSRANTAWAQAARYSFEATDNNGIASVTWRIGDGERHSIPLTEDGKYEFTVATNGDIYVTVTDLAGNASEVSTSETHIDTIAPVVSSIVTQSQWDTDKNTTLISASDNEGVTAVVVKDASGTETDITVTNEDGVYSFITGTNGDYTVAVKDAAGNEIAATFTVDHIDTDAPVIDELYKDPDIAWTAENIMVVAIPEDTQSGIKNVYYAYESANASDTDTSAWSKMQHNGDGSYFVTIPNDKDTREVLRVMAEDNVGRLSAIETVAIQIDITAPKNVSVTYDMTPDGGFFTQLIHWVSFGLLYKDKITLSIHAEDTYSGIDHYEYQIVKDGESIKADAWTTVTETADTCQIVIETDDFIGSVYVRVYDTAGNGTEAVTELTSNETTVVVLENTPENYESRTPAPELTAKLPNGEAYSEGTWTKQTVTITATSEGAISGVKRYEYQCVAPNGSLDEAAWTELPKENDAATLTVDYDLNADVYFRTVSYAENPSQHNKVIVKVQKTLPDNAAVEVVGKEGNNDWFVSYPTVTLTAPQPKPFAAPIETFYILQKDDGGEVTVNLENGQPKINEDGIYKLTVWTVDAADNVCQPKHTRTIKVDASAPTELDIKNGSESLLAVAQGSVVFCHTYNTRQYLTASANCDISGLASLQYQTVKGAADFRVDGNWQAWPEAGVPLTPDANCVVYLRAEDKAGNYTIVHTDGIIMDGTKPTGQTSPDLGLRVIGANSAGFFSGDARVDVDVMDPVVNGAMSGLTSISYQVVTNGHITQEETIKPTANGDFIATTDTKNGNYGYISAWNGSIKVKADNNNSNQIIVRVTAVDRAGNSKTTETPVGAIKIDTTAPTAELSYDNNTADTTFEKAYFDAGRILTIAVTERNFSAELANLTVTRDGTALATDLQWQKVAGTSVNGDDTRYIATFKCEQDGEYAVKFGVTDLAGNKASSISFGSSLAGDLFVVDTTAPMLNVSYDNNTALNGKYFDAERTATLTVTERNFDESRFEYTVTANNAERAISAPMLSQWSHNGATHTAQIRYAQDGDFTFEASVVDMAGNESKQPNYGSSIAPTAFTVDTKPVTVTVAGVEKDTAYTKALEAELSYNDINLDGTEIKLTRTNMEVVDEDVTEEFLSFTTTSQKDGMLKFFFPTDINVDGIFTLTYKLTDKAGHETADTIQFTVNRNGAVFVYSEDLLNLLNNYTQKADGNYMITAYNPSKITESSVIVTRDGEPITDKECGYNELERTGTQWYRYEYSFQHEFFEGDGQYRITLTTKDAAENQGDNTNSGEPDILFWVDSTAPEIALVEGAEKSIVNARQQTLSMTFFDAIGLANIKVYVNGEVIAEFTPENTTEYKASVELGEGLRQKLRIVVTDMAGNTLDTDTEAFHPAFDFAPTITVSHNFFVRWYANPWVFFGSIFGILLLAGAALTLIVLKKRKKAVIK